jgi:hypothetical protein
MCNGSKFQIKVYVVQKADRNGRLVGDVLAVKLTRSAAHQVARDNAPAKVTCVMADKTAFLNGPEHVSNHPICN